MVVVLTEPEPEPAEPEPEPGSASLPGPQEASESIDATHSRDYIIANVRAC